MGNLESNLDIQDSDYSNDEDIVSSEEVEGDLDAPETKSAKADESGDDVHRRKKIRRLLELQLERRRLRKEIDFYADLDDDYEEEAAEGPEDDEHL